MTDQKFEEWALVELFGHVRLAGRVTETTVGGVNFVRLDVPATEERKGFTKLLGQGAIYAITLVTEPVARALAESFSSQPVNRWDFPEQYRGLLDSSATPVLQGRPDDDGEDDDPIPY